MQTYSFLLRPADLLLKAFMFCLCLFATPTLLSETVQLLAVKRISVVGFSNISPNPPLIFTEKGVRKFEFGLDLRPQSPLKPPWFRNEATHSK